MMSALQADNNKAMDYVLAGVAFTNILPDGSLPTSGRIAYKLRFPSQWRQVLESYSDWRTNLEYPIDMPTGPRDPFSDAGGEPCKLKFFGVTEHSAFNMKLVVTCPLNRI